MDSMKALKGRDFLSLHDFTPDEVMGLVALGLDLKAKQKAGIPHPYLQGKTLGMIFEKSSTRTRLAFEVGMYQLGGHALFLSPRDIQLGRGETIADTARVLSRMVDGIMIRTFGHDIVEEMAKWADVPVINALTDLLHPTQVVADLMTIREHRGVIKGQKLVFVGDGNNMAHSLLFGGAKTGMHVTVACPEGYEPNAEVLAKAKKDAEETGAVISVSHDPFEAAKDADILYTDVWASMGEEAQAEEKESHFKQYQINAELLAAAKADALVLHCLPAKRGKEITEDVLEGPHSVVFDEAENRLHAHKAILAALL